MKKAQEKTLLEYVEKAYWNRISAYNLPDWFIQKIISADTKEKVIPLLEDLYDAIIYSEEKEQADRDAGEGL